jgi:hypothetical protein
VSLVGGSRVNLLDPNPISATTPARITLRHPHVLTPSEWVECDGITVALLPLVRGGTADVKPSNLLLEPTGAGRPHLWLGDLDVATRIGETGTLAGTVGISPPRCSPARRRCRATTCTPRGSPPRNSSPAAESDVRAGPSGGCCAISSPRATTTAGARRP